MAVEIGTATNHNDLLDKIRIFLTATLPLAQRHSILRNTTELSPVGDAVAEKVLILSAPGQSGTNTIYHGLKVYKSVVSDYYNFQIDGFTGYVPLNTFEQQPGAINGTGTVGLGVTLWNQSIPYWLVGDADGYFCCAKIQSAYVAFGAGFFIKYATFSQYPYPLLVHGNLTTATATRYSDVNWTSGFKGNRANCRMRFNDGLWKTPECIPYSSTENFRTTNDNPGVADGYYGLHPIELSDNVGTGNTYGAFPYIYYISGFNNAVENTTVVAGYIILRDGTKTGNNDYYALKIV